MSALREAPAPEAELWAAVDRLVARAPQLSDLLNHRLELFAARQLRAAGEPVPPELLARERHAAVTFLAVPALLERVRAAYDGPLLLWKGPEAAARYPDPALRAFGDVDLLTPDAAAAQNDLLRAGFREVGDPALYRGIHHLRPLQWPGLPLAVELHSRPKWLDPLVPPSSSSVFSGAGRALVAVDGFSAPSPARHAVLLAVHSWAHEPLRILRDLVDVAALSAEASEDEAADVAREWGVERLWATTVSTRDCLFAGDRRPLALRVWAQNLERVRERTVLENHVQRWLSDLWALPVGLALRRMPTTLAGELSTARGEGWAHKLSRSRLAVRNATRRRSEHEREAGVG
ncbi:MAG TPA: nucleotidyltransferase family protein [Gaiellaceae bacterium]|nr:nucleotidyltransferase family protein [Gaiellaceae bacterium]